MGVVGCTTHSTIDIFSVRMFNRCDIRQWRLLLRRAAVRAKYRAAAAAAPASTAATSSGTSRPPPQRVAVIGGGFAGLAVSWHLLLAARENGHPMQLQLFDAYGLGAGGSGAAAGLLHPYTPRGKMLWHGLEAFCDAMSLLKAAEAAVAEAAAAAAAGEAAAAAAEGAASEPGALQTDVGAIRRPFAWRHGMLRPARSAKQARDIARFLPADAAAAAATRAEAVPDAASLAALVPGLQPEKLLPAEDLAAKQKPAVAGKQQRRQGQKQQQGQGPQASGAASAEPALGLMVHEAVTISPANYMRALWLACQVATRQAGSGAAATLAVQPVSSLHTLQAEHGPFDAIVVAAGAAVGSIQELQGRLPLDLCHGYSLDMQPGSGGSASSSNGSSTDSGSSDDRPTNDSSSDARSSGSSGGYPKGAPSLLGSPYIAAHGSSSLVVGATKRYGLTPEEAYCQLSRPLVSDPGEAEAAAAALLPAACQLWPPLEGWQVAAVRAGVRALPVRGSDGSIPYAGCLPLEGHPHSSSGSSSSSGGSSSESARSSEGGRGHSSGNNEAGLAVAAAAAPTVEGSPSRPQPAPLPSCWVIGGLGARGLVYHAWLGRLVAAAVLAGNEAGLPAELLRWKEAAADSEQRQGQEARVS